MELQQNGKGKESEPLKEGDIKEGPTVQTVKLSKGTTAYRVYDPKSDPQEEKDDGEEKNLEEIPVVVCLHGFSNFSYCFENLATELMNTGVKVVTFDFYGRGRTPWPGRRIACTLDLLIQQTLDLITALNFKTFTLIGLSMGGAVAVRFAELYPDMVTSLILLGPAGLPIAKPGIAKVIECCCLGDLLMCCVGKKSLADSQKDDFYNKTASKEWIDLQTSMVRWQQRRTVGYMTAIHSTLRKFPLGSLTKSFQKVGTHRRRGLIIWGNKDVVCPYKPNAQIIEEMMPHLRLVSMTDCGHMVLFEKATAVTRLILAFLSVPGGRRGRHTYPSSTYPSSTKPVNIQPSPEQSDNNNSNNNTLAPPSNQSTMIEVSPQASIISESPSPPETLFLISTRDNEKNEEEEQSTPIPSPDYGNVVIHERGDSLG